MTSASRSTERERLDELVHDPSLLPRGLAQLEGVNRWLGGSRVIVRHLRRLLPPSGTVTILDCGTGAGDIPRRIARSWRQRGQDAWVLAVDRQRQIAQIAHRSCVAISGIQVITADGLALPLRDRSVDVAITSATLHHFSHEDAVHFVKEMARVSKCGIVVNDLERHPINHLGAQLLARTVWLRSPYRFDGPTSVRRSFRADELLAVGQAAQLRSPCVHRHFPYRLALTGYVT
jgi:2-polyprenyl-3-methyl-5-hydroxy-6-metoxy-1,4-benzoquinol methylase